jgi:hypothetical protein
MGYYMIPSTLKEALPTNLEQFKWFFLILRLLKKF